MMNYKTVMELEKYISKLEKIKFREDIVFSGKKTYEIMENYPLDLSIDSLNCPFDIQLLYIGNILMDKKYKKCDNIIDCLPESLEILIIRCGFLDETPKYFIDKLSKGLKSKKLKLVIFDHYNAFEKATIWYP